MLHDVKKAKYLEDYKIRLVFDDGSVKIVDLENFLKKAKHMLAPLKDLDYFKQVKCDGTTIVWPNGVDLCPDVLYKTGKDVAHPQKKRKSARSLKTRKRPKIKA